MHGKDLELEEKDNFVHFFNEIESGVPPEMRLKPLDFGMI